VLKRVLNKGTQKGVLSKIQRSRETASGSCGRICGVLAGSARQCGAQRSNGLCGMTAHRVHTAYSRNGCPHRRLGVPAAPLCASLGAAARRRPPQTALGREGYFCGTDRVLMGAHTVLTGYSNGSHKATPSTCEPPFCRIGSIEGGRCSAVWAHRYGVALLGTQGHLTVLLGTP
jgi:hypothetical protein